MLASEARSRCLSALALAISGAAAAWGPPALAAIVTVSGTITQSVADGTGPAESNPSLNAVEDGQTFSIAVDLGQPWTGAGRYTLPGSAVHWQVPAAGAAEAGFADATLLIEDVGSNLRFTLLACLLGGACATGNALSAIFDVALDLVTSVDAPAIGLDQPHPMQLLADDGVTDLQGQIERYSLAEGPPFTVAAPGTAPLTALALATAVFVRVLRRQGGTLPSSTFSRRTRS